MTETFTNQVQDYYNKHTKLVTSPFSDYYNLNEELLSRVFSRLDIDLSNKRVLDVGCGRGLLSQYIKKKKSTYVGVDITSNNFNNQEDDLSTNFLQSDSKILPFKDEVFDLIMVMDSFEHFPEPRSVVAELKRVIKRDGSIFLSVPNYFNIAGLVKSSQERFGRYDKDTWAPFDFWEPQVFEQFLTPMKTKKYFKDAGFAKFKLISNKDDYYIGIFPWAWHKKCPKIVERLTYKIQYPFSKIFSYLLPWFGLHNFWKISL